MLGMLQFGKHLQSLNEVLKQLATAGLQASKHKCKLMTPFVEFLGHLIDKNDI